LLVLSGVCTVRTVARRAVLPPTLTTGTFTLKEAARAGLTRRQLRGASWRRVSFGQYTWAGLTDSPELVLASVLNRLPSRAALSGRTAAWLRGLDFAPCDPIEVTIPKGSGSSRFTGVSVRQALLPAGDVDLWRGLQTTSALRTVFDLGSRPPFVEAVVAVDMALHAGLVDLFGIRKWAEEHDGSRGIRQFRRVVDLAEPGTESPMETRLRMLLIQGRLPRPEVQVSLHDDKGRFLGRADLYYPEQHLVLEYDGGIHRTSLIADNRRQNLLINAGFRILRFTFADVDGTPCEVVNQVSAALRRQVDALRHPASHVRP
jgi:very-short-patch-repair endonuclease